MTGQFKTGQKCKNSNTTFWLIFKHCATLVALLGLFLLAIFRNRKSRGVLDGGDGGAGGGDTCLVLTTFLGRLARRKGKLGKRENNGFFFLGRLCLTASAMDRKSSRRSNDLTEARSCILSDVCRLTGADQFMAIIIRLPEKFCRTPLPQISINPL